MKAVGLINSWAINAGNAEIFPPLEISNFRSRIKSVFNHMQSSCTRMATPLCFEWRRVFENVSWPCETKGLSERSWAGCTVLNLQGGSGIFPKTESLQAARSASRYHHMRLQSIQAIQDRWKETLPCVLAAGVQQMIDSIKLGISANQSRSSGWKIIGGDTVQAGHFQSESHRSQARRCQSL